MYLLPSGSRYSVTVIRKSAMFSGYVDFKTYNSILIVVNKKNKLRSALSV